jgi:hypothetical protein
MKRTTYDFAAIVIGLSADRVGTSMRARKGWGSFPGDSA